MKQIYIIKTGDTLPKISDRFSDFEDWIIKGLLAAPDAVSVFDAVTNRDLPGIDRVKGVVIAGSHAMVTDNLSWSMNIESWIPKIIENQIPLLGICYGHQLIARAMGGVVDYHPGGIEIGTTGIELFTDSQKDRLFENLPGKINVHVSHSQTVVTLPPGTVRLAGNDFEPHHAFRINDCAWGFQFHPEYDEAIMKAYISELAHTFEAVQSREVQLLAQVKATPYAALLLERFGRLCGAA